jgi:nicotinamidase-related amidase
MQNVHLVVIDPQMDFCTPDGTYGGIKTGALYVPGADEDMKRLAKMVNRLAPKLADIHITLDSHHLMDVAHPLFWKDTKGRHPDPFTVITAADVRNGVWTTSIPSFLPRMLAYVEALESSARYPLMIWPPHCLISTPGQSVVPELTEAVNAWAASRRAMIDYVTKGSNIFTEHYSAVRAEVPDPSDPTTQLNTSFIKTVEEADLVIWAGEASSHCVANTMRDTFAAFGSDAIKKMVLLTDAISAVPNCNKMYDDFFAEMTAKGMKTATTADFLA